MTYLEMGNSKISFDLLKGLLPDVDTALFFGSVYKLSADQMGSVLRALFKGKDGDLMEVLTRGDHSVSLQDYIVELSEEIEIEDAILVDGPELEPDKSELLIKMVEAARTEIATSIKEVAEKLKNTISRLPSKQGQMVFQAMRTMNLQRNTIGNFKARVKHEHVPQNLVILDVSGSMSEPTVRAIVEEVVGLAYDTQAHLALVSSRAFHAEPGAYDVQWVLNNAQYGGTVYESLLDLFKGHDWGTVICVADYDSGTGAQYYMSKNTTCKIGQIMDISLVNRRTYLSECLMHMSDEPVRELLQTPNYYQSF